MVLNGKVIKAAAPRVNIPPTNGELLLSYWKRIDGQFDGGFIEAARAAAEKHGFFYERGRMHRAEQT